MLAVIEMQLQLGVTRGPLCIVYFEIHILKVEGRVCGEGDRKRGVREGGVLKGDRDEGEGVFKGDANEVGDILKGH